jgi:serine/threonine protein kinase
MAPPDLSLLALLNNTLSRYRTDFTEISCIGKGGFGRVYKARHNIDGRFYAIKQITFSNAGFAPLLQRKVLREVTCLAKLDHPNICRYYNAWTEAVWEEDSQTERASRQSTASSSTQQQAASSSGGVFSAAAAAAAAARAAATAAAAVAAAAAAAAASNTGSSPLAGPRPTSNGQTPRREKREFSLDASVDAGGRSAAPSESYSDPSSYSAIHTGDFSLDSYDEASGHAHPHSQAHGGSGRGSKHSLHSADLLAPSPQRSRKRLAAPAPAEFGPASAPRSPVSPAGLGVASSSNNSEADGETSLGTDASARGGAFSPADAERERLARFEFPCPQPEDFPPSAQTPETLREFEARASNREGSVDLGASDEERRGRFDDTDGSLTNDDEKEEREERKTETTAAAAAAVAGNERGDDVADVDVEEEPASHAGLKLETSGSTYAAADDASEAGTPIIAALQASRETSEAQTPLLSGAPLRARPPARTSPERGQNEGAAPRPPQIQVSSPDEQGVSGRASQGREKGRSGSASTPLRASAAHGTLRASGSSRTTTTASGAWGSLNASRSSSDGLRELISRQNESSDTPEMPSIAERPPHAAASGRLNIEVESSSGASRSPSNASPAVASLRSPIGIPPPQVLSLVPSSSTLGPQSVAARGPLDAQTLYQQVHMASERMRYKIRLFIQTQLCEGLTLSNFIAYKKRPLEPAVNMPIVHQILCGLQHIHYQGVMHRDLKPSNLFVLVVGSPADDPAATGGTKCSETERARNQMLLDTMCAPAAARVNGNGASAVPYLIKIGDFGLAKDLEMETEAERLRRHQHHERGADSKSSPALQESKRRRAHAGALGSRAANRQPFATSKRSNAKLSRKHSDGYEAEDDSDETQEEDDALGGEKALRSARGVSAEERLDDRAQTRPLDREDEDAGDGNESKSEQSNDSDSDSDADADADAGRSRVKERRTRKVRSEVEYEAPESFAALAEAAGLGHLADYAATQQPARSESGSSSASSNSARAGNPAPPRTSVPAVNATGPSPVELSRGSGWRPTQPQGASSSSSSGAVRARSGSSEGAGAASGASGPGSPGADISAASAVPDAKRKRKQQRSTAPRVTGVGTLSYSSPEQLSGALYSTKSDIYSLGVILFELYTSFHTAMERAVSLEHLRKGLLPEGFEQRWPEEARLIRAMTAPQPSLRPSATELLNDPYVMQFTPFADPRAPSLHGGTPPPSPGVRVMRSASDLRRTAPAAAAAAESSHRRGFLVSEAAVSEAPSALAGAISTAEPGVAGQAAGSVVAAHAPAAAAAMASAAVDSASADGDAMAPLDLGELMPEMSLAAEELREPPRQATALSTLAAAAAAPKAMSSVAPAAHHGDALSDALDPPETRRAASDSRVAEMEELMELSKEDLVRMLRDREQQAREHARVIERLQRQVSELSAVRAKRRLSDSSASSGANDGGAA